MDIFDKQLLKTAAEVMAECFIEDPLNKALLKNISQADKLMNTHSTKHIAYAAKLKILYFQEGIAKAFCIWSDSEKESKLRNLLFIISIYLVTLQVLGVKEMFRILQNSRKINKVLSFTWQKEFIKGCFFRLKIIAVHKSLRGTGIFRKLITPLIEKAEKESIPIVLETHNPENVPIYEKFGFNLVKTITHPLAEITQYCMVRQPVNLKDN